MKTYKLYIRFFLLVTLIFAFNQQVFSIIDSFPTQKSASTIKSSQKENLQKRLHQQREKLKSLKKECPSNKNQHFNYFDSKTIWVIVLIIIAILGTLLISNLESFDKTKVKK